MNYHLIGAEGVSMRGLKKYLIYAGHKVTGSDIKTSGHSADNITKDLDVVVRTSAVNPGSPGWVEVEEAEKLGIKVIKRSELIKEISRGKTLIAVSGAHGKTTVTAMAGLVLQEAGLDPTVLVGDEVSEFGNDVIRIGKSKYFVLEACEYDHNLDFVDANILILTNIEAEHLDTYPGGLPEIKEAFLKYINRVPDEGLIIACSLDENVREVLSLKTTKARVIYYGESAPTYQTLGFELNIPGKHNILNALAVVALADYLNIDKVITEQTLKKFSGAHRRFEKLGQYHGSDLIDDYGHHPTEIKATVEALAERYPNKRKVVVFWPHQYKRIMPLIDQFSKSFDLADEVILKPIYFVPGRDEILPISSHDLAEKIGDKARVIETDEEIVNYLANKLDGDSVLLTIGIPPVYKIAEKLKDHK